MNKSIAIMRALRKSKGQTSVEAIIVVGLVAIGLLAIFPILRNSITWMWKNASDQVSGFVPY